MANECKALILKQIPGLSGTDFGLPARDSLIVQSSRSTNRLQVLRGSRGFGVAAKSLQKPIRKGFKILQRLMHRPAWSTLLPAPPQWSPMNTASADHTVQSLLEAVKPHLLPTPFPRSRLHPQRALCLPTRSSFGLRCTFFIRDRVRWLHKETMLKES